MIEARVVARIFHSPLKYGTKDCIFAPQMLSQYKSARRSTYDSQRPQTEIMAPRPRVNMDARLKR